MILKRVFTFLFTVFLALSFTLPESVDAQDPRVTPGFDWEQINFQDDPNLSMLHKNKLSMRFEERVSGPKIRIYWTPNAETVRGEARITDRMNAAFEADSTLLRSLFNRADAIRCEGTNNFVTNNQQAEYPQTAEEPPASQTTADADLAETRSHQCEAALSKQILGRKFNFTKIENGAVSVPDELQNLQKRPDDLSDIQALLARKSFVVIFDIYNRSSVTSLQGRLDNIEDDLYTRVDQLAARLDSLAGEHSETRARADSALAAAKAAQDSAANAQALAENAQDVAENVETSSFSALSASYRNELGLHIAEVGFEIGNPFSLRFAIGANPGGIDTKLCKGDVGVSNVFFAEGGGAYTFRSSDRFSIGAGISTTGTLFSLDGEDKGLFVFSGGPDVFARLKVFDHVHLHGSAGLNGRYFLDDGVELSKSASTVGTQFSAGVTISF